MIARTWRGVTRSGDAAQYVQYMRKTGVSEYLQTEGNRGALVLRRNRDDETHFLFVSLWDSIEAVRRFAGEDYEVAVFYPQDDDFLIGRDLHVEHYDVAIHELDPTSHR